MRSLLNPESVEAAGDKPVWFALFMVLSFVALIVSIIITMLAAGHVMPSAAFGRVYFVALVALVAAAVCRIISNRFHEKLSEYSESIHSSSRRSGPLGIALIGIVLAGIFFLLVFHFSLFAR